MAAAASTTPRSVHPIVMGIEDPRDHARLRRIRETVGVAPVWEIKGSNKAGAITRFDDVEATLLGASSDSPQTGGVA